MAISSPRPKAGGSSPRVRGTLGVNTLAAISDRFIPACAGNTTGGYLFDFPPPVHPRVCGEHRYFLPARITLSGSSPRVRGTPLRNPVFPQPRRFIPACAGNTDLCGAELWHPPVHPRVCGEHLSRQNVPQIPLGSSPRVRGTLWLEDTDLIGFCHLFKIYQLFCPKKRHLTRGVLVGVGEADQPDGLCDTPRTTRQDHGIKDDDFGEMVPPPWLEQGTSGSTIQRSNQLS